MVAPDVDNMSMICSAGRKVSLNIRMVNQRARSFGTPSSTPSRLTCTPEGSLPGSCSWEARRSWAAVPRQWTTAALLYSRFS